MTAEAMNVVEWQKHFGTEEKYTATLAKRCWPNGIQYPRWGHDHGSFIPTRHTHGCSRCHYQASLTAGTLPRFTNFPLTK